MLFNFCRDASVLRRFPSGMSRVQTSDGEHVYFSADIHVFVFQTTF